MTITSICEAMFTWRVLIYAITMIEAKMCLHVKKLVFELVNIRSA